MTARRPTVLTVFGTRPETIKLAPVIRALEARGGLETVNVATGQHLELVEPFVRLFGIRVDHALRIMAPDQTPSDVCARVLSALDPVLLRERPDLVLVQGDTTSTLAGALAAFHRGIPVGHVEAGLRTSDPRNPFPEEMNRRLVSRMADHHFAATRHNRDVLLGEGVDPARVHLTGNPVVDALGTILERAAPSEVIANALARTDGCRRILLTTHRRESFGAVLHGNLGVLAAFLDRHPEARLLFPVHPNPTVRVAADAVLGGHPAVELLPPLDYADFLLLMQRASLIVSDSGGVQEEAPTLGKPVLVLRANTERPEAVECGVARLVGGRPERLAALLEEAWSDGSWAERVASTPNPFGQGDAGERIARAIEGVLGAEARRESPAAAAS